MRAFAISALLGLATAYSYNEDRSVEASRRMRSLSYQVCDGVEDCQPGSQAAANGAAVDVGDAVLNAINELCPYADDIPGLGYMISIVTGGNSDTAAILAELEQIEYELNQINMEMQVAWSEIMDYQSYLFCATQLNDKERQVSDAFTDFLEWQRELNKSSPNADIIAQRKQRFVTECSGNKCLDNARYLLNALDPKGNFPSTSCNDLNVLYENGLGLGYKGYRNEIARKAGALLVEATVAVWMQTAYDILNPDTLVTPEEALQLSVDDFGDWLNKAGQNVNDSLTKAKNEWESTRGNNENIAYVNIAGKTNNKSTIAKTMHETLVDMYPWRQWLVTLADREDRKCRFDYTCDSGSACTERHDFNNQYMVVATMDPSVPPINALLNWCRLNWVVNTGGEFCTAQVCDYIWDNGCGGGVVATKPDKGMVVESNFNGSEFLQGKYEHTVFWGAHSCTSIWGTDHCNAAPAEFLQ